MSIIIQKYGGTSVSSEAGRAAIVRNVKNAVSDGFQVVVVVSALGRKGDPYATDTLIDLYQNIHYERQSEDLDLIMSCGEMISASLISNTLRRESLKSKALTGFQAGIFTDELHGNATVTHVKSNLIKKYLMDDFVVVVTGFQGISLQDNVTTLGRGGSDTTAVILGEALDAELIEIYTDVSGVMTADPRLIEDAHLLHSISYDEVYQMALDGAKVIDSKAVAIAKRSHKPIIVKNTFTDEKGTKIFADEMTDHMKIVTAVTYKNDILQVRVKVKNRDERYLNLLNAISDFKISIDLINFFENEKIFTVEQIYYSKIENLLKAMAFDFEIVEKCSKVTIVGHGIHGVPGVMNRVVTALTKSKVNILQTADSHTTISCLVRESDIMDSVKALHDEFKLYE